MTEHQEQPDIDPDDELREDDEIPDNDECDDQAEAVPFEQGEEDPQHRFAVFHIPVPEYHE